MQVLVRYFAAAREAAGREEEAVDLPEGATVSRLRDLVVARHPDLAPLVPALRYARGERFVPEESALVEGDAVAFLPPVSGG